MSKTALYDVHLRSKAHIVDFFGWKLPMHFGSQINEHMAVRTNAGIFDVSHMNITDITGEDATAWLRTLLTCDIQKTTHIGQAQYCLLLNENGGIIDDLIVYKMPVGYRIVSNCGTRQRVNQWLKDQKEASKLTSGLHNIQIQQRDDLSIIAAQGPKAFNSVFQVIYTQYEGDKSMGLLHHHFEYAKQMAPFMSRTLGDIHLSRTGYTGEDGVELILPHELSTRLWTDLLDIGVQPCGLGARDTLRLEAGMSLYGQDMNEDTTPKEARLNWTLDLKDPDRHFIGRAASQGRAQRFKTSPFIIPGRGIPRQGHTIFMRDTQQPCGKITSGTYSPNLKIGIGYCQIPTTGGGHDFETENHHKKRPISLIKGAFYKHGKSAYRFVNPELTTK